MYDSGVLLAFLLIIGSLTALVSGYKVARTSIGGRYGTRNNVLLLRASLKPQITKLIARQDLSTAETEV